MGSPRYGKWSTFSTVNVNFHCQGLCTIFRMFSGRPILSYVSLNWSAVTEVKISENILPLSLSSLFLGSLLYIKKKIIIIICWATCLLSVTVAPNIYMAVRYFGAFWSRERHYLNGCLFFFLIQGYCSPFDAESVGIMQIALDQIHVRCCWFILHVSHILN